MTRKKATGSMMTSSRMAKKRIALRTIVAWLGPAALDETICEMLTISAQTEQANSVTRGRIFHLLVWN